MIRVTILPFYNLWWINLDSDHWSSQKERKAKNLCLLMEAPGTICTRCPLLCYKPPPKLKRTAEISFADESPTWGGQSRPFVSVSCGGGQTARSLRTRIIRRHVHLSDSQSWSWNTSPGLSGLLDLLAAWRLGYTAVCRPRGGRKLCCSVACVTVSWWEARRWGPRMCRAGALGCPTSVWEEYRGIPERALEATVSSVKDRVESWIWTYWSL